MVARDDVFWAGIDGRDEQVVGEDAQGRSDHDPASELVVPACQCNVGAEGIAAGVQLRCFINGIRRMEGREIVVAL